MDDTWTSNSHQAKHECDSCGLVSSEVVPVGKSWYCDDCIEHQAAVQVEPEVDLVDLFR